MGKKVLAEGGSRRYFVDAPMGAFMVLRTRQHGRAKMDADSGEMRQGWEALVAVMDAGGAVVVRGMPGSALGTALWAAQTDLDAALNDDAKARSSGKPVSGSGEEPAAAPHQVRVPLR